MRGQRNAPDRRPTNNRPTVRRAGGEGVDSLECYTIPFQTIPWAVINDPSVRGVGAATLRDGTVLLEGQSAAGQFWTHTLYVSDD